MALAGKTVVMDVTNSTLQKQITELGGTVVKLSDVIIVSDTKDSTKCVTTEAFQKKYVPQKAASAKKSKAKNTYIYTCPIIFYKMNDFEKCDKKTSRKHLIKELKSEGKLDIHMKEITSVTVTLDPKKDAFIITVKASEELDTSALAKVDLAINQTLAYEWDIASMFDYGNCGIHITYSALKRI